MYDQLETEDLSIVVMNNQFSSTNFLSRAKIKEIIECIPSLSCYGSDKWARRPPSPEAFQLLIKIVYEGALRIDEGLKIRVNDFNPNNSELSLPETKTGWRSCKCAVYESIPGTRRKKLISTQNNCHMCHGKGKLRVTQYTNLPRWLSTEIIEYIRKNNLQENDYLFGSPSFPRKHISYGFVQKYLPEITEKCQLKISAKYKIRRTSQLYTHIFRKSKAKQMLIDGFTLGDVSKKLRHRDASTTTIYILSEDEDLARKEQELELKSFDEY
jgi:integrase